MSVVRTIHDDASERSSLVHLVSRFTLPEVPAPLSPILGRDTLIAEIRARLREPDGRLVTLTGPGGIGKTRLALEVARAGDYQAAFVPLVSTSDPDLVASTIARALHVGAIHELTPQAALRAALRDRSLLLVLDNFEQVLAGAPVISELLGACPGLRVLVTSRRRLSIAGEQVVPVEPLALPPAAPGLTRKEIAASDAVHLFVERVRRVQPAFALNDHNAAVVASICRRLDGLPLAIELAAARGDLLSVEALDARLANRFEVLGSGLLDETAHHCTIWTAIARSSDLLTEPERAVWMRLSVFTGGFTAEAAEAIGSSIGTTGMELLTILESLIEYGLLRSLTAAHGEPRFQMLETTRTFALSQLAQAGLEDETRDAHATWFVGFGKTLEPGLMSADPWPWFRRAEADIANIRATLTWLRDRNDPARALQLANSLAWFWTDPGYIAEGISWFDSLLAADPDIDLSIRAAALNTVADLCEWQGDLERTIACHREAVDLWRSIGDTRRVALTLRGLGSAAIEQGAWDDAVGLLTEAHELAGACGDAWTRAAAANLLGLALQGRGELATSVPWHEAALRQWQQLGDRDHFPPALNALGSAWFGLGDEQRAWESFDAALNLTSDGAPGYETLRAIEGLAMIAARNGQPIVAVRLLSAVVTLRGALGMGAPRPFLQQVVDRESERLRAELGSGRFAVAWAEGRDLGAAEVLREARAVRTPDVRAVEGISPRELEVLAILVEGASDQEIADALFISRRTVSKHVAAILEKLGVTNRTAAATAAHRRGLV